MAEHQPGERAQHRDVVGRRLGVRRPDADVDHRDTRRIGADEMVARHLRQPRRRLAGRAAAVADVAGNTVAGLDEGVVVAVRIGHFGEPVGDELVDVELVVGEDDVVLEMLRARAGVVAQPVQRVVDARRGEQGQRLRPSGCADPGAVDDRIVHLREVGHVEPVADRADLLGVEHALDVDAVGIGEVDRDRRVADADLDRPAVVADQLADLFLEIAAEEVRPGHRRGVGAGRADEAVGEPRVDAGEALGRQRHRRIVGAHPLGRRTAGGEVAEVLAQIAGLGLVEGAHVRHGGSGIAEAAGLRRVGAGQHGAILGRAGPTG